MRTIKSLIASLLLLAAGAYATDVTFTTADDVATLQTVIESLHAGDRILLGDGLYSPAYTIYLTNGVTLAGSHYTNCVIRPSGTYRVVYMAGSSSCVSNITLTGGKETSGWLFGGGILMYDGTISHCMVSNNAMTGSSSSGGGIMAHGGTVSHTIVSHNTAKSNGGGLYVGAYGYKVLENPVLIDRCLVTDNTADTGGGIFTYAGAGGNHIVIRQTTVANNTASTIGGLYVNTIGTIESIESCIFADNVQTTAGTQIGQPNWQVGNGTTSTKFTNCLFGNESGTTGTDPVSGDAVFKSLSNGDYHLSATSDAIDTALVSTNVTDDLDGKSVTDGKPDIGCYEFDLSSEPFSCVLDYAADSIFVGTGVSLVATPVNPPSGVTLRYAWTVTDGVENTLSAFGTNATVMLANVGTYSVTLRVYNDATDTLLLETVGETTLPVYVQTIYADPDDDIPTICTGLVDGQQVFLAAGTYSISQSVTINADVDVIGAGRDLTILELSAQNVVLNVSHIYATLSGVTICRGVSSGSKHVVTVQRGTLRDARITQCAVQGAMFGYSPLLIDVGALVERCIIDNNTNSTTIGGNTWTYTRAAAVQVKNGTLRNCLVHHNYASASDGTVFIGANNGGNGLVESCTIVDNRSEGATLEAVAVLIGNNAYIRNSIVARNASPNWTTNHTDNVAGQTPAASPPNWAVRSDASSWTSLANNNCFGESPLSYGSACADGAKISFASPDNGNWLIRFDSSCRNAGVSADWMTDDAIDLAGNPRIFSDAVDIGCYENQRHPHTIFMLR